MTGESGARARVLVVDDSKLMRKAAHKMLGDEFDVVTGDDGADAWAQIQQDPGIQVVFTDLNMPRMDGYELLRTIRGAEDPGVQGLPVIVVTGADNDEAARMKALDQGATDFITKPFTTSDLVARARAHANYQRVTRQLQSQVAVDALTGLANKAGFMERLQQDIAYARRHQQPLCLVRLEVEDFRRFFLYYGRDLAEALVLQLARQLRTRIRKEDTAARIGLGGFALSLPGGQEAGIVAMVERLQAEVLANPPVFEGEPVAVKLHAAVLSPLMDSALGPQEAMDACQARLDVARESSLAVPEPVPAPTPAPAPAVAAAPVPAASPAPAAAPVSVDAVLELLREGRAQEALPKLPAVIGRLLPLLRLLGPNQRAQLIQFLQK